jgi:hypothetical protein
MKKLLIIPFLALFLTSCDDSAKFDYDNGQTVYLFSKVSSDLIANNTSVTTIEVPVAVTTRSKVDRVVPIVVDPTSTATANMYTIDQASLVIPAGQFSANVKISGNFANIPANNGAILKLMFGELAMAGKDLHTISLSRFCATSLAGNYNVTTSYTAHDFLPSYSSNTMTGVAVTAAGVNMYKVADFSGGLYSTGPYASSYGTASAPASTRDLTFVVNCGDITWTGESDPWGAIIPQSLYTGAGSGAYALANPQASTYNPATGVIKIAWYCVRYGESGVSVYTPAN